MAMAPTTAFVSRKGPTRFTSKTWDRSSQAVSSSSGSGVGPRVLALCTSTSMGPTSAEAAPTSG